MITGRSSLMCLAVVAWASCSESLEPDPGSIGLDHFPLAVGNFRDYGVQQITYRFSGSVDTVRFELRELAADSYTNEEGGTTFVLNRSVRNGPFASWVIDSVWSTRRTSFQAIQVENNQPFVKLVFPVAERKTWDGNALNGNQEEQYRMVNVFQPFSPATGSEEHSNTITVIQSEFDDGITRIDQRKEVYALDIGLVYRSSKKVEFCTDPDCLGMEIIEVGMDWQQTLIDFGAE